MYRPLAAGPLTLGSPLPLFDGFPYFIVRVVKVLRHVTLLPADSSRARLEDLAHRQWEANRLDTCLVVSEDLALYLCADGRMTPTSQLPRGGVLVTGRLRPPDELPIPREVARRSRALARFIERTRPREGYLMGDLTKGGRAATLDELVRLEGRQPGGVPRGLLRCPACQGWTGECLDPSPQFRGQVMRVHCRCENNNRCARCRDPLAWKLNANYYDEADGQIWYVPGFVALSHRCEN